MAAYMIALSVAGLRLSSPLILGLAVLPIGSLLLLGSRVGSREAGRFPNSPVLEFRAVPLLPRRLSVGIIITLAVLAFVGSLAEPIAEVDAAAAWSLHAKVFFFERTALPDYLTLGGCGRFVSHWPPLFPLAQTWTHIAIGAFDDLAVKITFPFYFLALLAIVYGTLRRHLSSPYSLAVLITLASVPALVVPFPAGSVASGYADLPLAMATAGGVSALLLWIRTRDRRALLLAAVFAGLAIWTKREGLVFAAASGAAVWAFCLFSLERRGKMAPAHAVMFTSVCLACLLLQVLYRRQFSGPFFCEVISGAHASPGPALRKFLEVSRFMLLEMLNPIRWGFLWLLAGVLVVVRFRALKMPVVGLLAFLILVQIAAAVLFMTADRCSARYHAALDMRRVLIHVAPAATMLIALLGAAPADAH
jgi:hypothetical protein